VTQLVWSILCRRRVSVGKKFRGLPSLLVGAKGLPEASGGEARSGARCQPHSVGPGRAGDAAEAPVRVRSRSESLQWAFSNWCRIISVVILFVGFLVAVIYASAKLRFVEDVLPRISGAFSQPWRTS
jgi:hypothetical protein